MIPIGMKLPRTLIERIEKYAERLNRDRPGLGATRSSAIRMLLHSALEAAQGKNE